MNDEALASTDMLGKVAGPVIDRSLRLPPGQFVDEPHVKNLIVLHFTAGGRARDAFNWWLQQPQRIGTAYIIDLDGTIYETFPPDKWAYALGIRGGAGGPTERRAIQIEQAGWGPLRLRGNTLYAWPGNWTRAYCRLDDTDKYIRASYRGTEYFTSYPEAQMSATCALVKHLCETFSIPKHVPPAERRGDCDLNYFGAWHGITAHQNWRADKTDVGPAFNWDRLASAVIL